MDHQYQELESRRSGSFGRLSHASSSRRRSFSISFTSSAQNDYAAESESVSESGDIGDRALHSNRISESGRSHFSLDNVAENGIVVPIPEDTNTSFPVTPSALENISPLSVDAIIQSGEKKKDEKRVPWLLEYITCLLSLAVFGILGVLARYGLQKLFGPEVVGATSDGSYMYLDLPSNMVGSFLMGWLGVVFKGDLLKISDQLAIGLTTGFLGSLTTFSGWNQKMLDLSVEGRWVFAVLGILIGLFLVAYSIIFGIETAKGFKWLYRQSNKRSFCGISNCFHACISNTYRCVLTFMVMLLLMLGLLWGIFGSLEKDEFNTGSSEAQLFLACMVGPFGVWIRWFLARLNGRGLGKNGMVKWMPFGTLAANVLAACVMAALATLKKAVKTTNCNTVASGIQFGLLGCLSTVSTFIAEFHAMRESTHPWRAYAYAAITFTISYALGTLIYSVPVWARGYN
ncbi:UNVERIFIED_CONTAM: putative fluoride ion transporter CrcB 2 [Sesamum calycinum]|uniref:Fluoride ion transporter CrcB 2 n=1 Tax=Sesamum calycinum TaxID=2727403 RepID=A0AAW2P847_9LAMI